MGHHPRSALVSLAPLGHRWRGAVRVLGASVADVEVTANNWPGSDLVDEAPHAETNATTLRCWLGGYNPSVMFADRLSLSDGQIRDFCSKHHIRSLAFFGSVLRDDFGPASDVDILVEFELGYVPGLLRLAAMERELSATIGGRRVDMRTPRDLSRYFRDDVLAHAVVQYAQG